MVDVFQAAIRGHKTVWHNKLILTHLLLCLKVHMATRWTIRHGLMLLWFEDLMNVTEKLQFIDPTSRHFCLLPSSGVI